MRVKRLVAIFGLFLFCLMGSAWAENLTGVALCVSCHDEEDLPDMSRSAHGFSADKRVPDCLTCHGASLDHANNAAKTAKRPVPDRIFSKKSNVASNELSEVCLTCHIKDAKQALWSGSQHQAADVTCNACHKIHVNRDKVLNKITQPDVCYTCHKEQRAQMNKASHHPVPEGKMTCADCHSAHGSAGPKLVKRDSINNTCYTCHAEKRGPFVHQHDPVAEDCANCHVAHGGTVAGMLKARAPMLCQQCHTPHAVGGVGVASGGRSSGLTGVSVSQGRSCMNCHTQVHGSNNPSTSNSASRALMR